MIPTLSRLFPKLLAAAALFLFGTVVLPASLTASTLLACPNCISSNVCADIESSGSTGCSVTTASGCEEELGICVCGNCDNAMAKRGAEHRLAYDTPYGKIDLVAVGKSRYAAWSCTGKLIFLVEKGSNGQITEIPVMQFRNTYSL